MIQATALCAPQIVLFICFLSDSMDPMPKRPAISSVQNNVENAKRLLPPASPIPSASSGGTLEDAQREALRRSPDLGVAGSPTNTAFVARFHRYQTERPDYFQDNAWPIRLADEIAIERGGR